MAIKHLQALIFYTLLLSFAVIMEAYNKSFSPNADIWHSLRPGELLHNLDLATADAHIIQTPFVLPPPPATRAATIALRTLPTSRAYDRSYQADSIPQIQRRIESSVENQYSTEDHLDADHSNEYDYDKAYEQFVQRYFGDARDDALDDTQSGSVEIDELQPYSSEYENSEPLTASASKSKAKQKCKKVLKNQRECLICKNPKNNEKSETCSFSTESEPESYAYTKEKSYKKHRDSSDESLEKADDDDDVDDDDEDNNKKSVDRKNKKKAKRNDDTIIKRKVKQNRRRLGKRDGKNIERRKDTGSCTRKNYKYKTCYYCTNLGDKNLSRCFAKEADPLDRNDQGDGDKQKESAKQIQRSEKKIYKRMVTYSYENGTNFDFSNELKNDTDKNSNAGSPRFKRKIVFKLLNHKATEEH